MHPFHSCGMPGPILALNFAGKRTAAQRSHLQVQQWPVAVLLGGPTSACISLPSCDPPSRSFSSCHVASNRQTKPSTPVRLALLHLFFLLGTARSRDSTFRTRLNAAEMIGLLNSRPSFRRFSRGRVHEIRVLLPAPLHAEGSRNLSFDFWRVQPPHQLGCNDMCRAAFKFTTTVSKHALNTRIQREIFLEGAPCGLHSVKRGYFRRRGHGLLYAVISV